jgi:hypothetical protein
MIWTSPALDSPQGRQIDVSWAALAARCAAPRPGEAKGLLARWAPVAFRNAYRCRGNVERAYAVTLDVDDGTALDPILRAIEGLRSIVHSTFSATPEAPRWRIVVAIDRTIDGEQYERVWRWLACALEQESATPDYAARDASRAWAVPAVPPSGHYWCRVNEGRPAKVADALDAIPPEEPLPSPTPRRHDDSYDALVRRARLYVERMPPAIEGSGGSTQTLKVAIALVRGFAIEPDDALAILVEYNARCQPEWSQWELKHKIRQAVQRSRQPYGYLAERKP